MKSLRLQFDDIAFEVAASDRQDLVWLREFLCPHYERARGVDPHCRVSLIRDDERHRAAFESGEPTSERLRDCFALDSRVLRLPSWSTSGSEVRVYDEKFAVIYEIDKDRRRVRLLAGSNNRRARIPLMRVLREYAMNRAATAGGLFLHASCLVVDGQAVLVTGPSGAGKTSLLIQALSAGTGYLSNDRVLVKLTRPQMEALGMPTIVTIRTQALELMPSIHAALTESTYYHASTIAESLREQRPLRPWHDGRYGLSPAQFLELVGAPAVPRAPLGALLMPAHTGRPDGIRLEPIDPDQVRVELMDAVLGIRVWSMLRPLFALRGDNIYRPDTEVEALCTQLAEQVPCFRCHLGIDAYEDHRRLRETFRSALG